MANPSHRHPRFLFRDQVLSFSTLDRESNPKTDLEDAREVPVSKPRSDPAPRERLLLLVKRALVSLL